MSLIVNRRFTIKARYAEANMAAAVGQFLNRSPVLDVALSPSGEHLWIAGESGLYVYAQDGNELYSRGDGTYNGVYAPGLANCAFAVQERTAVWVFKEISDWLGQKSKRPSYEIVAQLTSGSHQRPDIHTFAVSPDGEQIVVGHTGSCISLINRQDGSVVWERQTGLYSAWQVAWIPDTKNIVALNTGGVTQIVSIIDVVSGAIKERKRLSLAYASAIAVAIEPIRIVIAFSENNNKFTLRALDHKFDQVWEQSFPEAITALSADLERGHVVFGMGSRGYIGQLEIETGEEIGHSDRLGALVNCLDSVQGGILVCAGTFDGHAFLLSNPDLGF